MSGITFAALGKPFSVGYAVTNAMAAAYTCNVKRAILVGVNICNIDGTNAADFSLNWYDSSLNTSFQISSTDSIAADTREGIQDIGIVIENADEIRAQANANGDLVIILTFIEILT
jgi:hypothetical protein